LADLVTAQLNGLLLVLQLRHHHLQLLKVGISVLRWPLATGEILHGLLENVLGLGTSLDLPGERTNTVYICLKIENKSKILSWY
jgi:hypothetical protein